MNLAFFKKLWGKSKLTVVFKDTDLNEAKQKFEQKEYENKLDAKSVLERESRSGGIELPLKGDEP